MDGNERGRFARLVATPRRRVLLAVVLALGVGRAVLPAVLRPILVARVDEALVGHIELADLDLSLLRGGVTLHGLSVHTDERPAAAPPLFTARRLWTQISWLALATRTIEIEDFEVEGFEVHLERDTDGLRLPRLAETGETSKDEPEAEAPRAWSFAADAIALYDGRIELVDHTVKGGLPHEVALSIEDLSARELAVRSDPGDDEPGRIAIEAKLDEGWVSLSAWIQPYAEGVDIRSTLVLDDIPIDKLRAYLSSFGWSALSGTVDASLEHRFESGRTHQLSGKAELENLRIAVKDQPEPALAWKKLEVVLDRVDLVGRHAEIAAITSSGARVVVDPRAETPLALLAGRTVAGDEPASEPSAPGWTWRVAKARVEDAVVDLRGAPEALALELSAAAEGLSSEPENRSPITLFLTAGEGQLRLAGELSPAPFAFDGRVAIEALALAPLLARIEAPAVHWLKSGTLRADLLIRLARDLRAAGQVGLADLDLEEAGTAEQFGVEWKDLELAIESLAWRALTPETERPPQRTLDVVLARIALVEPRVILTRSESGLVLPPLLQEGEGRDTNAAEPPTSAASNEGPSPAAEPAADPSVESPAREADESALPIRLRIAVARIDGGRLTLSDRGFEPGYRGRIGNLALHATGVRWPEQEVEALELSAEGLRGAHLSLSGSIHPGKSKLEGELVELPLAQFNPYLASTGYDLKSGKLSLESRIRLAPEKIKTKSRIVVAALDVGGQQGETAFRESFGIPLDVALGLLKDLDGKIKLAIPVAGKPENMKVGIGRLVAQALRKALVGALASPLKLLGAGKRDGEIGDATPAPIAFRPGESTLAPEAFGRIEELGTLLEASPGIGLRLAGQTDAADDRIVCERALLKQLEASRGVRALAALGEITTRRAVREHLSRKLAGKSAPPLAPDEARWLESQLAPATAPAAVLESLALARAEALREVLTRDHRIAPERLVIDPAQISPPAATPGVAIALGLPPKVDAKIDEKVDVEGDAVGQPIPESLE